MGDGLSVGPILLGVAKPAHILTPSVTVRGIVNMTAVAVVDAQGRADGWMDARSRGCPAAGSPEMSRDRPRGGTANRG